MAGIVQPTLEQAQPLCWVIRAAGSLKSGLALAPGSDPESASSSLRGASTWRSGHPVCGPWRSVARNWRWPRPPRRAQPARAPGRPVRSKLCHAQLLARFDSAFFATCRATWVCADHVVPCPATKRAAVLLIENDSISRIGPSQTHFNFMAQGRRGSFDPLFHHACDRTLLIQRTLRHSRMFALPCQSRSIRLPIIAGVRRVAGRSMQSSRVCVRLARFYVHAKLSQIPQNHHCVLRNPEKSFCSVVEHSRRRGTGSQELPAFCPLSLGTPAREWTGWRDPQTGRNRRQ